MTQKELLQDNPLTKREGLPDFDNIKTEHVVPAMSHALEQAETELSQIEANFTPTWEGLCQPLEDIDLHFDYTWSVINHLVSVKNSEELRKAYQEVLPKVINFSLRMSQSKPIYEGLKKLKNSPDFEKLNDAKKRIIEHKLKSAEQSGVGLEGKTKERFNEIANRLSKLATDFSNNVLDATKAYELVITKKQDTEGWTSNLKNLAAQSYAQKKDDEDIKADPENGPWRITLDNPIAGPFLQHSRNREQRKQVYHSLVTKASSGKLDNTPLIEEILKLRKEMAEILGYKTFAELSLSNKMAPDVDAVNKMSQELATAARPFAKKEFEDVKKLAKEMGHEDELKHCYANWPVSRYL
jgi:oligopeptidase A